ncbi:MAG: ankyrin repeat domain-containing protein [Candidatus Sericytochromatia bacterium]|nr:ankyrin repeat domain-containing protein [Candidatus Sericytochromatia bacterium]
MRVAPLLIAATMILCSSLSAPEPVSAASATELGLAASSGDVARIKALVAKGQSLDTPDSEGYTPLMWAALNGQVNAVATLVYLKANLDLQDREGYTALIWATQNKYETVVRQLVNAGAALNTRDNHGYTALHWSAQDGQLAVARILLAKGADPNVRDNEGYTPLMWAAQQGHGTLVYEMLAYNANPDLKDKRGFAAHDLASAYNHPGILAQLKAFKTKSQARPAAQPSKPVAASLPTPSATTISLAAPGTEARMSPLSGRPEVVPVRSDFEPKVLAVVGGTEGNPAKAAFVVPDLQKQLARYDVDRNRVIDGRDWRNLTTMQSRVALAKLLYQSRTGQKECGNDTVNQVISKIDWVYQEATRRELTLNQAWDTPSHHFEPIRW